MTEAGAPAAGDRRTPAGRAWSARRTSLVGSRRVRPQAAAGDLEAPPPRARVAGRAARDGRCAGGGRARTSWASCVGEDRGGPQSTVVKVPVRSAYDQWTQFEEFPSFMSGVEEVRQLDDRRLHWRGRVAGKVRDWDATIAEQEPDRQDAWQATGAPATTARSLQAGGHRHDPGQGRDGVRTRRRRRTRRVHDRTARASRQGRPRAVPRADRGSAAASRPAHGAAKVGHST